MTREQLERLAEKINGKWSGVYDVRLLNPPKTNGLYLVAFDIMYDRSDSDAENSPFIIWCLDRLEEMEAAYVLVCGERGYGLYEAPGDVNFYPPIAKAPTRAEALALALLAKLEEE